MVFFSLLLVLAADDPADSLAKKMLPVYVKEAAEYSIAIECAPKKKLERKKEPVFEWSNPIRERLQQGVIFLWLRDGRPAALGCIFSQPEAKLPGRRIIHEFHALDRDKLLVSRPKAFNEWKPQAGLTRKELPGSGAPAATAGARLVQMRRLAREFTGHEMNRDGDGKRWELRLLPTPLYRYPVARRGVVDGALFALVSTIGTDPEVLLLLEARQEGAKTRWEYACGRFSNFDLHVQRNDKEIWSSVRSKTNTFYHDPLHLYRVYGDKIVSVDGTMLARVREKRGVWGGEVIPVNEK
ncbi:MAG TPA: hypothetical protein VMG10_03905 [Gemmataceae bacterium]|nr:hypothetical protein [Gemmataceae bacterium]